MTQFRILGPLDVRENGADIDIGGGKQRALLALLVLHGGESLSTDRLIDALWGGSPPSGASASVHVYVSRLRRAVGADRPGGTPKRYPGVPPPGRGAAR